MKQINYRHTVFCSIIIATIFFTACKNTVGDAATDTKKIGALLDSLNIAAAKADYNTYFSFYADSSIFTGTDAMERWNKKQFMEWARPIFAKGKAWNFTSVDRHVYFDKAGNTAWFDELLSTQMKICRGSGVLIKQGGEWKIAQYILSATIPNEQMDTVVKMKTVLEDDILNKIEKNK